MKYILASASPRRKELLRKTGISFEIMPSSKEEVITEELPADVVTELAYQKAADIFSLYHKIHDEDFTVIGADTVVHLDPWWNFAAEEQATDRAYRIGQTKPVTVYKLVCHDSVEERVIDLQNAKKELYDSVIKDGDNVSSMSEKDYKFILS